MNLHHCNANGCTWATEPRMLMCLAHWRRLPSALQSAVLCAYRAQPNASARARDLTYMAACADAVEHIARLEGKPEANSYRRAVKLLQHQAAGQLPQMTAGIQAAIKNAPQPSGVR